MIELKDILKINNGDSVDLNKINIFPYNEFYDLSINFLKNRENHCVNYFVYKKTNLLQFIMAIANDTEHKIYIFSHTLKNSKKQELNSLTKDIFALHIFEREIYENFGINFLNHPWLKPVRYAHNRADKSKKITNYPFYSIKSHELHEVGVGPIHAGIIEPGHFRFICNGENVLHLEIQLGWQHRGIEQLFLDKKYYLQKNLLAENISGDTVIGHTTTFVRVIESLSQKKVSEQLEIERALALELERIAIHTLDLGALCTDIGYSLGANVFGILRTPIINFTQSWSGNRFGKGLIRIGGTNFPFTKELKEQLLNMLKKYEIQFEEMVGLTFRLTSIQNRFDFSGIITEKQVELMGTVGLSARMSNLKRDIRVTHPSIANKKFPYKTILVRSGDVFARFLLKKREIRASIKWIRNLLNNYEFNFSQIELPIYNQKLIPNQFTISLNEGWRGEICHCALTDNNGELILYKIKDPSFHNWKALELSLRNVEISDFPINNKSYNLSYCGHDL